MEVPKIQPHRKLAQQEHQQRGQHGGVLSDHSRHGCALDSHGRETEQAEDHNGVENDVGDGSQCLEQHGEDHRTGGLEHLLNADVDKGTGTEGQADVGVGDGICQDCRIIAEQPEEGFQQELSRDDEQNCHKGCHEKSMGYRAVCSLLVLPAQAAGDIGIDSHTNTH